MDNSNEGNGVNTILIVIVLLLIVAAGVWYFTSREDVPVEQDDSVNIDLSLGEENGEALPQ